jgi:hypothetical protein
MLGNNVSQTRTVRFQLPAAGLTVSVPASQLLLDLSPFHRWVLMVAQLYDAATPPNLIIPPGGPVAGVPFGVWSFDQNRINAGNLIDNTFTLAPGVSCLVQVPANQRIYGSAIGVLGNPVGAAQVGISVAAQNFLEPTTKAQTKALVQGFRDALQQVVPNAFADALRIIGLGGQRGR